jgi:hypothetical protein
MEFQFSYRTMLIHQDKVHKIHSLNWTSQSVPKCHSLTQQLPGKTGISYENLRREYLLPGSRFEPRTHKIRNTSVVTFSTK